MPSQSHHRFAIIREIPNTFDQCIKPLESPRVINVELARIEHQKYRGALSQLGFELIVLPADSQYPDCPFVEDTALVIGDRAIIARPGAESRRGEVDAVWEALTPYKRIERIVPPGTLDGGDVLWAEDQLFIGLTRRTNREGFRQIETLLKENPLRVVPVAMGKTLHLKTACNYLGKGLMVVNYFDFDSKVFSNFEIIQVDPSERPKLSFLSIDESVLLPEDCPKAGNEFEKRGWKTITLPLSEIRKAQAGLTCMSILFRA